QIRELPAPAPARASVLTGTPARRLSRWLGRPRAVTVRLRPVWTLALAAGLTAVLLLPWRENSLTPGVAEGVANFVGHFPGARSVEVVGSFNDWSRGMLHLNDDDHDGVWQRAAGLAAASRGTLDRGGGSARTTGAGRSCGCRGRRTLARTAGTPRGADPHDRSKGAAGPSAARGCGSDRASFPAGFGRGPARRSAQQRSARNAVARCGGCRRSRAAA